MPEVAGDAALLVNPFEINEIANTKTANALWDSIEKVLDKC